MKNKMKKFKIIMFSIIAFLCVGNVNVFADTIPYHKCFYQGRTFTISYLVYTQGSREVITTVGIVPKGAGTNDIYINANVNNNGHSVDKVHYEKIKNRENLDLFLTEEIDGKLYFFCPTGFYYKSSGVAFPNLTELYSSVTVEIAKLYEGANTEYQKYITYKCTIDSYGTETSCDDLYTYNASVNKDETDMPEEVKKCETGGYEVVKSKATEIEKMIDNEYSDIFSIINSTKKDEIDNVRNEINGKISSINTIVNETLKEIEDTITNGNYCINNDELLKIIKEKVFSRLEKKIDNKNEEIIIKLKEKEKELEVEDSIVGEVEAKIVQLENSFEESLESWQGFTMEVPTGNLKTCINIVSNDLIIVLKLLSKIIRIAVPILLIVFVTIDFASGVISNDKEAISKIVSKSIKRAIAALVIFFIPTVVNLIISMASSSGYTDSSGNELVIDDTSCVDALNE